MVGGAAFEEMGVAETKQTLVIYGKKGTLFAPRVWSVLKRYYPCPVKIMHGTLEDWIAQGGLVDTNALEASITANDLLEKAKDRKEALSALASPTAKSTIVGKDAVMEILESSGSRSSMPSVIIDTRGSGGYANGHIPTAKNIPFASLTYCDNRLLMKPRDELESILREELGEEMVRKLVAKDAPPVLITCHAAISLCTLDLVLDELGFAEPWIYDGSWNEWGQDPLTPKEINE